MIQAVLGIIGLGLGLINFFVGQHQKQKQEKIEAEEGLAETQIGIKEAQYKIGGYEEFLAKVPTAGQALTETTGDLEFDEAYRSLMKNYSNFNVMAGMTGRVAAGTSAAATGKQNMQNVEDLVGVSKKTAEQQLDIYQSTLEALEQSQERYQETLDRMKRPGF